MVYFFALRAQFAIIGGLHIAGKKCSYPELDSTQRIDLYNTIVHENVHANGQSFFSRFLAGLDNDWRKILEKEAYDKGNSRSARDADKIRATGRGSCDCKK